jgi:hypothetical protein
MQAVASQTDANFETIHGQLQVPDRGHATARGNRHSSAVLHTSVSPRRARQAAEQLSGAVAHLGARTDALDARLDDTQAQLGSVAAQLDAAELDELEKALMGLRTVAAQASAQESSSRGDSDLHSGPPLWASVLTKAPHFARSTRRRAPSSSRRRRGYQRSSRRRRGS